MARPPSDERVGRMEFQLQLRQRGIIDKSVMRALDEVPREYFVPPDYSAVAYADHALPIACGQTISQPYIVAYMTEQLGVRPHHRVLEIGTGSGYQAAVLSRLAREVVTVERYHTLAETARARIETLGYHNVDIIEADGIAGLPDQGKFDRIIVTAATDRIPETLIDALNEDGVMILPLGPPAGTQYLVKLTKTSAGIVRKDPIPVRFVPLVAGKAREL
jgi:protein-L-isoaspartate(D-aspartate) O-methyltransferase